MEKFTNRVKYIYKSKLHSLSCLW